ncbi:VOC family protein, partial [Nocardia gipuzkoensis]|uniref:VOC family protein n=1 Tax=Nocardia gipuzkoensis TaxID=2749991 RepID=UPI003CC7C516
MNITTDQPTIESVVLEVPDSSAAEAFYAAAFGLGDKVRVRASEAPTSGFRGFILSLVVSQPSTVDSLISTAVDAGATTLKPAKKSFWGYGGVVQAPDGGVRDIGTWGKKGAGPGPPGVEVMVQGLGG